MSPENQAEELLALANSHWAQGRLADAETCFQRLLTTTPGHGEGHHRYGLMLAGHGRGDLALPHLARAEALLPGRTDIKINCATVCQHRGDVANATRLLEAARDLGGVQPELFFNLGVVYEASRRTAEAAAHFARAAELNPLWPEARIREAACLQVCGRVDAAIAVLRSAQEAFPDHKVVASNLLLALNYSPTLSSADICAAHRDWGNRLPPATRAVAPRARPKRLRLGFVSPNYVDHSVVYFLEPLIENLSRLRFECFAYSLSALEDHATVRLKSKFSRWRDAARLDDAALATAIGNDRIDVLIDLAGHTGENRLSVFASRAADLQLSMIGYPATTGLPAMDYCITDATLDPPEEIGTAYVEQVARLPLFCCYRPPQSNHAPGPLPLAVNGHPTFGSFQSLAKLSPVTLDAWAQLFRLVPDARLVIRAFGSSDALTRAALLERLAAAGIAPNAVRIENFVEMDDYFSAHREIDIFLDTLPWNGHTTTCHALWMGVPTLTLVGDRRAGRMGKALLQAAGLPQFIADSPAAFAAAGRQIVDDVPALAAIRAGLRARLLASPLCDARAYARSFEQFVEAAWTARTTPD